MSNGVSKFFNPAIIFTHLRKMCPYVVIRFVICHLFEIWILTFDIYLWLALFSGHRLNQGFGFVQGFLILSLRVGIGDDAAANLKIGLPLF